MDLISKHSALSYKVTNTNFSALSNIPPSLIQQIKKDFQDLSQATRICNDIWLEMRKTDFTTQGRLKFKIVNQIFDNNREHIVRLLGVNNGKQFFELFDQDIDGEWNEDEQILFFNLVKEKMQVCSNQLLYIQDYLSVKTLMKELRQLEVNICNYQNHLRQKIYQNQNQVYHQIGNEKLEDFYDQYDQKFTQLETYKNQRREQLRAVQSQEMQHLLDSLCQDVQLLKIKPKKKLSDLQTQEKLVSLEERVEEALDFRKELKDMEVKEKERVEKTQIGNAQRQQRNLELRHKKESDQLEAKLQEQEYKLIIQMNKDYDVLQKKIHLHQNDINRIQGLTAKLAQKKGIEEGELKRSKIKTKLENQIIMETKQFKERNILNQSVNEGLITNNKFNRTDAISVDTKFSNKADKVAEIKNLLNSSNIINFYIRKNYGQDRPVNLQDNPYQHQGTNDHKIQKILLSKKKSPLDILPSLTDLYDFDLNLRKKSQEAATEKELQQDKEKKKKLINEKLLLTK